MTVVRETNLDIRECYDLDDMTIIIRLSAAAACAWQYHGGWSSLAVALSFDQDGGVGGQAEDCSSGHCLHFQYKQ